LKFSGRKFAIGTGLVSVALGALGLWLWTPDKSRAELEARYATAPTDFVEAAGVRLHVRDTGRKDAPAVILLHGFGASLHTWEPWAVPLSEHLRVIRYDLTGAGLTGADPTGDYTDERAMQLLIALMDRLGIASASIVGHSMGGRVAWRFAAEHPDRVDRLVLVAPDGFASPGFEYDKKPDVPAMMDLMRYVLPKTLLRMNLAPAYADSAKLTDAVVTRYHDLMVAPGVRGALLERLRQVVRRDPIAKLASIQAPVLLMWGEKDAVIPATNAADYQKALKQSTLVTFPDVGHIPQEEAPDASLPALRAFLAP
jgi:pimeloyl-ACP methyl ester carboxylesterase